MAANRPTRFAPHWLTRLSKVTLADMVWELASVSPAHQARLVARGGGDAAIVEVIRLVAARVASAKDARYVSLIHDVENSAD